MSSLTSLNRVTLIGNVGNLDVRTMQDGREMATISLATTDSWKDKTTGEWRNTTEWHRVKIFNTVHVNIVKSKVKVGSRIMLEGALRTRKAQDPNTNTEKYYTDIVLQGLDSVLIVMDKSDKGGENSDNTDDFNFEASGGSGSGHGGSGAAGRNTSGGSGQRGSSNPLIEDLIDDDIPF